MGRRGRLRSGGRAKLSGAAGGEGGRSRDLLAGLPARRPGRRRAAAGGPRLRAVPAGGAGPGRHVRRVRPRRARPPPSGLVRRRRRRLPSAGLRVPLRPRRLTRRVRRKPRPGLRAARPEARPTPAAWPEWDRLSIVAFSKSSCLLLFLYCWSKRHSCDTTSGRVHLAAGAIGRGGSNRAAADGRPARRRECAELLPLWGSPHSPSSLISPSSPPSLPSASAIIPPSLPFRELLSLLCE